MKAAIFEHYGTSDVVTIKDIPKPEPKDNQVLIQTRATTVNSADCRIRSLNVPRGFGLMMRLAFGILKPRKQILGTELSGVIVATGKNAKKFKVGDEVIAFLGGNLGAHAEVVVLEEKAVIVAKPKNLSFEQATCLAFGGTTALDFLKNKADIQPSDKVLINGASGTVGVAAIQLAKYYGAHVTAVCSKGNHEFVKSLGADSTIDYQSSDFSQIGEHWDIIMDNVGTAPWRKSEAVLNNSGRLLMIVSDLRPMITGLLARKKNTKRAIAGAAREHIKDLQLLVDLAEKGVFKAVIDSAYSFDDIQVAHQRVDTSRKRGSVVVTV